MLKYIYSGLFCPALIPACLLHTFTQHSDGIDLIREASKQFEETYANLLSPIEEMADKM